MLADSYRAAIRPSGVAFPVLVAPVVLYGVSLKPFASLAVLRYDVGARFSVDSCTDMRSVVPAPTKPRHSWLQIPIAEALEVSRAPGPLDTPKRSGQRLLAMEGLRGLAVFLVFLVHYYALFGFLLAGSPSQNATNIMTIVGSHLTSE